MTRADKPKHQLTLALAMLACVLLITPTPTHGQKPLKEFSLRPPAGLRSRSLGYPWAGQLVRGMRLRESSYVRYVSSEYTPGGHFYGTWQLVQLIERAARRVAVRLPGSRLSVGELSNKEGGDIGGHGSHESGRDADIGFFMKTSDGRPFTTGIAFAQFAADGRGVGTNAALRFDDARNWELVSKLVDDADARVQYIFVARQIRARLLREAARRKASAEIIARASAVLVQPAHGNPHGSHFHVRIYCPPADRPVCLDVGPYWPWYPGAPASPLRDVPNVRAMNAALGAHTRARTNDISTLQLR
jgi:penicillin-insensitive murein DD-endopeptidase